jgi:hypothetical protein
MSFSKAIAWLYQPFWAEKFNPDQPRDEKGQFAAGGTGSAADALRDHANAHEALKEHNAKGAELKGKLQKAMDYWKEIGQMSPTPEDEAKMKAHEEKGKELQANYNKTREALKPHADTLEALAKNLKR